MPTDRIRPEELPVPVTVTDEVLFAAFCAGFEATAPDWNGDINEPVSEDAALEARVRVAFNEWRQAGVLSAGCSVGRVEALEAGLREIVALDGVISHGVAVRAKEIARALLEEGER